MHRPVSTTFCSGAQLDRKLAANWKNGSSQGGLSRLQRKEGGDAVHFPIFNSGRNTGQNGSV